MIEKAHSHVTTAPDGIHYVRFPVEPYDPASPRKLIAFIVHLNIFF